ncbi:hypothetical protein SPFL3102_01122 [Sporomusaceae bacterium FL31]|nr:hypothetical protein SPFL3101_00269 [Sporomusaceae bacterium FL31]GCE33318.1 hypothetical protein SPFL3102_01122 [Sporomusaceae bacterium]
MMKLKIVIIVCMLCLAVTGSTIAWLYFWGDFPKKSPIRAKQVYLIDKKAICFGGNQTV